MQLTVKRASVEVLIANVDLVAKLDALGAALVAVREAHRDEMSAECWATINQAQERICAAMLLGNRRAAERLNG